MKAIDFECPACGAPKRDRCKADYGTWSAGVWTPRGDGRRHPHEARKQVALDAKFARARERQRREAEAHRLAEEAFIAAGPRLGPGGGFRRADAERLRREAFAALRDVRADAALPVYTFRVTAKHPTHGHDYDAARYDIDGTRDALLTFLRALGGKPAAHVSPVPQELAV